MTTMQSDPLVDDYLRRLEAAAADPPHERRVELVTEIDEHIVAALREGGAGDEAALRNVLERLGPPGEIAEEAGAGTPAPGRGQLEIAALLVLAVVPVPGPRGKHEARADQIAEYLTRSGTTPPSTSTRRSSARSCSTSRRSTSGTA